MTQGLERRRYPDEAHRRGQGHARHAHLPVAGRPSPRDQRRLADEENEPAVEEQRVDVLERLHLESPAEQGQPYVGVKPSKPTTRKAHAMRTWKVLPEDASARGE
jgi:hypothetical protein